MKITIVLNDRLGEDIKKFCKLNNMTYTSYLSEMIEKQFNLDRFGDLNLKIKKKNEIKTLGESIETHVEPEKTTDIACFPEKQANEVVLDSQGAEETNANEKQNKTKRRQLKVK